MQSFSIVEMWNSMGGLAKGTAAFMALMSLWSIGVMIERLIVYSSGSKQSFQFVMALRDHMQKHRMDDALKAAQAHTKSPLARMMEAGIGAYVRAMDARKKVGPAEVGEFDVVDAVNRSLERVKERETANLRRGIGGLGTVASAAPFVGLFGTVVGIINAFRKLSGGGGLDVIGPGIAEALVSTAFGLLVAIPALMMFNYFTGRVEFFVVDMNDVSSEFVDYVLKEGRDEVGGKTKTAEA